MKDISESRFIPHRFWAVAAPGLAAENVPEDHTCEQASLRREIGTMLKDMSRNALVVVAHPDPGSFNHALAHAVHQTFQEFGFHSDLRDLHAESFNPILTPAEARGLAASDPVCRGHIELLVQADAIAVVHPNYWGAPPAMMKGWVDRVFAHGAAYAFEKGGDQGDTPKGLLKARAALVLNTSNTAEAREAGVFGDPLERMWRDCLLNYCGVGYVKRHVFRIVATSSRSERVLWIEQARALAKDVAELATNSARA
jgi:NAD(P)H dehydrogenase (quinone)